MDGGLYPTRARARAHALPARGTTPKLHPEPHPGQLESIADEIADWVEVTSSAVALAVMDGTHAPFSARATQAELSAFYGETLFDQTGMPVTEQWSKMYQRTGADGLKEAVEGGRKYREAQGLPVIMPPPTAWAQRPALETEP
jgi:hypothetical protein